MQKYEQNLTANSSGALRPLAGASVTVTDLANGLPAALFEDDELTPIPQPLTTDNTGYFAFKAADGKYTLTFSGPRFATFTREILLEDPADNPAVTAQELALPSAAERIGYGGRKVSDKLGEVVSVKDSPFNARGDGATDDTAAIQAAIDAMPATGGAIYVPSGTYIVTGLKLDGTGRNKSNITLHGDGPTSRIRLKEQVAPAVAQNVIETLSGSGFVIRDLAVEGNASRGGAAPPFLYNWRTNNAYKAGEYASVNTSNWTGSPSTFDDPVYRCLADHTSGATITPDIAKWELVTAAGAGDWPNVARPNNLYIDKSFEKYCGLYLGGCTNVLVENVEFSDTVYAGLNLGSGPLIAAVRGPASSDIRVAGCRFKSANSGGIAGGYHDRVTVTGCTFYVSGNIGYQVDEGADEVTIAGNTFQGDGTGDSRGTGVLIYLSKGASVTGNTFASLPAGVNGINTNETAISANTFKKCIHGIIMNDSLRAAILGNVLLDMEQHSITCSGSRFMTITGNSTYGGYYGIRLLNCEKSALVSNMIAAAKNSGIHVDKGLFINIAANVLSDNNSKSVPDADGAGIYITSAGGPSDNVLVVGNRAFDFYQGHQKYGLVVKAGCTRVSVQSNDFTQNSTGPILDETNGAGINYGMNILGASGASVGGANHLRMRGASAGGRPTIVTDGVDPDVHIGVNAKGSAGRVILGNNGQDHVLVGGTAAAVANRVRLEGGTAGQPISVRVDGSDADVDIALTPKGAGRLRFGNHIATADAPITGYLELKDSGGTVRKLAVIA